MERAITGTFAEHGLVVFDYHFAIRPGEVSESVRDIWGGYQVSFKVTTPENQAKAGGNIDKLRREALPVQSNGSTRIEVDISKFEYVGRKQEFAIDGFRIYIYSPEMIVFEKLRAICQQHPPYAGVIPGYHPRARARDFYDILSLVDQFKIDPATAENKMLIEVIFEAKRVPLSYIRDIRSHLDIHRGDWQNLLDTLPALDRKRSSPLTTMPSISLVCSNPLHSRRIIKPPRFRIALFLHPVVEVKIKFHWQLL